MDLIFLHGPIASGKLTIARELAQMAGLRLFHNHLTVDLLTAVFDFGTKPFVILREQIWLNVFSEAAKNNISLVFTFTPEQSVSSSFIEHTLDAVESVGGRVLFVALTCSVEELERRITSDSRATFGKVNSVDHFRELNQSGAFAYPKLPDSGLSIETNQMTPREAASKICAFFSL